MPSEINKTCAISFLSAVAILWILVGTSDTVRHLMTFRIISNEMTVFNSFCMLIDDFNCLVGRFVQINFLIFTLMSLTIFVKSLFSRYTG